MFAKSDNFCVLSVYKSAVMALVVRTNPVAAEPLKDHKGFIRDTIDLLFDTQ